jgi:hypothetical protein
MFSQIELDELEQSTLAEINKLPAEELRPPRGFPWTLVGSIDMPNVAGPAMSGDDSEGTAASLVRSSDTITSPLAYGTRWSGSATAYR